MEAGRLRIGDVLVSHNGRRLPVEGIADSDRVETVYNLEVEDDHTYFVGAEGWGFSVWVHNAFYHYTSEKGAKGIVGGRVIRKSKTNGKHSELGPVVFLTPLDPATVAGKGGVKKVLGLTKDKAKKAVQVDTELNHIKPIPGPRGEWIWYSTESIRFPGKGPITVITTGF